MRRTRIYGPYEDKKRRSWTVVVVEEGKRSAQRCESKEDAHRLVAELEEKLKLEGPITVEAALEDYEKHLAAKGNKPGTIATTKARLQGLVRGMLHESLARLSSVRCGEAYCRLLGTGRLRGNVRMPIAVDTHRNALGEARTFGKWSVKMGHLRRNPWDGIEPIGRRKKGKKQLRVDEARRFVAKCLELGDDGAVAALCCLLLGLRASEVIERVGRDVDDGGRLLWIDRAKTESGKRVVEVPELLREALSTLALGHGPGRKAPRGRASNGEVALVSPGEREVRRLFSGSRFWLRDQVERICVAADVPVVCPHGLRGTHASLAMAAGSSSALVAASMGHSPEVMLAHYAQPGAVASGAQERLLKVLAGGRK